MHRSAGWCWIDTHLRARMLMPPCWGWNISSFEAAVLPYFNVGCSSAALEEMRIVRCGDVRASIVRAASWASNQCQEMTRRVDALGRAAIRDVIFQGNDALTASCERRVLRTVVSASWGCSCLTVCQVNAHHRLLAVWRVVIVAATHRLHLEIKEERARAAGQGSGSPVSDGGVRDNQGAHSRQSDAWLKATI